MNQINNDISVDSLNMLFMNIERKFKLTPFKINGITSNNGNTNRVAMSFVKINSCNSNKMKIKLKHMLSRKM